MSELSKDRPDFCRWFWINLKIGALSFGAVSRIILYEDAVVREQRWLNEEEFREALTLAQVLPGPNLVNLAAALGFRLFSPAQAILALLPLLLPGAIFALIVGVFVPLDRPWIKELFRGFAIGALFLMVKFLWTLSKGVPSGVGTQVPSQTKITGRYFLFALVSVLFFAGVPLLPLIFGGVFLCLSWEFAT